MADEQNDEKTEEATQTRRDDFRKRGQVPMSKELGTAMILLASSGLIMYLGEMFFNEFHDLFNRTFSSELLSAAREGDLLKASTVAGQKFIMLVFPWLMMSAIFGIFSSWVQVGFIQVEDALSPKLERLDPIQGFFKIFSMRNGVEFLKNILKISVGIGLCYSILKSEMNHIPHLMQMEIKELAMFIGQISGKLLATVGFAMLALALGDYFYQRWDIEKQMMMTKQEVKEEMKNRELDPLIKSRIRKAQREMSKKRMMADVPKADVIITNPTHIAVALKYDQNLPSPQLIAKGADLIADKIKELAKEHNIPIVENKPLARTIYKTMKIGQTIPRELYLAVAEVLSYVYKLKKKLRRGARSSRETDNLGAQL